MGKKLVSLKEAGVSVLSLMRVGGNITDSEK